MAPCSAGLHEKTPFGHYSSRPGICVLLPHNEDCPSLQVGVRGPEISFFFFYEVNYVVDNPGGFIVDVGSGAWIRHRRRFDPYPSGRCGSGVRHQSSSRSARHLTKPESYDADG